MAGTFGTMSYDVMTPVANGYYIHLELWVNLGCSLWFISKMSITRTVCFWYIKILNQCLQLFTSYYVYIYMYSNQCWHQSPEKNVGQSPSGTLPCQDPAGALWRNARSVQWGPWAEVGMAVQANTLGRAKSMGCRKK